jgi:prepilin-type processing-associated H-X9-DG protein
MGPAGAAGAILSSIDDPVGTIIITDGSSVLLRFNGDTASYVATKTSLSARGICADRDNYRQNCLRARHLETMNCLFVDGHVKAMQWQRILGNPNDPNAMKYWTTASSL